MIVKLHQFFTPNLLIGANHKTFKRGETFTLHNKVGVVLTGVFAEERLDPYNHETVTLRLAGFDDMLNINQIFDAGITKQFVCETSKATIAILDIQYFRKLLDTGTAESQNILVRCLLSKLLSYQAELIDTATYLGRVPVQDKVAWALYRFQSKAGNTQECLRKNRLAAHIGVATETVSRILSKLKQQEGL